MQNDQVFSEILNLVSTKDDFLLLTKELDLLGQSLYKLGQSSFESALVNSVRKSTASVVSNAVAGGKKPDVLDRLKEELKKIEFIDLTVATEPSSQTLRKISDWVKSSVGQNIAINIIVDKDIISGAIISFRGKYLDFSIKSQLDSAIKKYV